MRVVLDASALAKWFLVEEESREKLSEIRFMLLWPRSLTLFLSLMIRCC